MNTSSSNYTGRMHRSMESAFGPYERGGLYVKPEPIHTSDRIVVAASAVAAVVMVFVLIFN